MTSNAIRSHPLFRDFEKSEAIWLVYVDPTGEVHRVPATAVEPPGDQSSFTFQAAEGHLNEWPWWPHGDGDEHELGWTGRTLPVDARSYYIMAGSDGLFEEDMDPMGPYPWQADPPRPYGQMLWTWEYGGITFHALPREEVTE